MQDHAYDIRQMYIKDYSERVKLQPDEQRAMWMDYLKLIKHPRMEPITRREPVTGKPEINVIGWTRSTQWERDRAMLEALSNEEKDRAAREVWKEI